MFDFEICGGFKVDANACGIIVRNQNIECVTRHNRVLPAATCLLISPGFRQPHSGLSIDQAKAIVVGKMETATVPGAGAVEFPSVKLTGFRTCTNIAASVTGGVCQDFLHIAPAQLIIGFEHKGNNPSCRRSGRRGATETGRVCATFIPGGTSAVGRINASPICAVGRRGD